ncbi:nitroreductase family protein [Desulfovibrio litoralis]|uniref:Nitroreductase n=1 Tax=Desulfovibrio litoralis DSM 11393 TaxID=1121455 RepID=A0A1M7T8K9_9BACT|nr:nitroreductase family protein [Desulfovibrio litoralis]SHN67012.1 Nitroreductase [Desulfovibrio litoralis DSM 11393]
MSFKQLVIDARTCRRFDESKQVSESQIVDLIDTVRVVSCTGNKQSLRYSFSISPAQNAVIFSSLKWAMMLKDWAGPKQGERPTAYIIIANDENILKNPQIDLGIAAQTLQLAASSLGLASCMFSSMNAKALHKELGFADNIEIMLTMAFGYPLEKRKITELGKDGSTAYWRDEALVHYVPKRNLNDILLKSFK